MLYEKETPQHGEYFMCMPCFFSCNQDTEYSGYGEVNLKACKIVWKMIRCAKKA